jgi:chromosomal replication initiation ATPase DnaA
MRTEFILNTVSSYYNIPISFIKSELRRKDVIKAKHVYFYLCCILTDYSLEAIGKTVSKDHATVSHARNKITSQLVTYKDIKEDISEIKSLLVPKNKLVIENVDLLAFTLNRQFINAFH